MKQRLTMRWSEAGYLSQFVLAHALRQVSVSLILSVRQKSMKAIVSVLFLVSGLCHAQWIDYEFRAFSRSDLEDARDNLATIAIPRLVSCVQLGLYGKAEESNEEKQIALHILRNRADFQNWFHSHILSQLRTGYVTHRLTSGGSIKVVSYPEMNATVMGAAIKDLFDLLEIIGTKEAVDVLMRYSSDDRHLNAPRGDIGSMSIGVDATMRVRVISRRLGLSDIPDPATNDAGVWQMWLRENEERIVQASDELKKKK